MADDKTLDDKWTLLNIPPKGHREVGKFALDLFEIARKEIERLKVHEIALRNYAMYRGHNQDQAPGNSTKSLMPANLYFANIERTVSNITARDPVGEVVDMDGKTDDAEKVLSAKNAKWWKDTNQRSKTRQSAKLMEIYGIAIEKPWFDFKRRHDVNIELTDMFGFFPAPGYWDNISEDAPYVVFAYTDFVDKIESEYDVSGVAVDAAYELLGQEREKYKKQAFPNETTGRYAQPMLPADNAHQDASDRKLEMGLILEVWIRDTSTKSVTHEDTLTVGDDGEAGEAVSKEAVYPDGIRKITITRADGKTNDHPDNVIVLNDSANPNINPKLEIALAKNTHPWGRFPCYTANSYKDPGSIWGFAAAEQIGVMLYFVNEILRKLVNWTKNVMTPPLIIQKHCGITRSMIESDNEKAGRLVLMPTIPNARIEFMAIPNLPASFFNVLDLVIKLHDRIHAIEEADRGEAPNGVIAAQAIVALQEKNQVALQPKTISVESLVENRSKWAIGLWQNWGTEEDLVNVNGNPTPFVGTDYAGRKFNFVVESGSTVPRTSLQNQQVVMDLADRNRISTPYLLETLNLPNWQQEVARQSGPIIEQAFIALQDAGVPPEMLEQVYGVLQQQQAAQAENPSLMQKAEEGQEKEE